METIEARSAIDSLMFISHVIVYSAIPAFLIHMKFGHSFGSSWTSDISISFWNSVFLSVWILRNGQQRSKIGLNVLRSLIGNLYRPLQLCQQSISSLRLSQLKKYWEQKTRIGLHMRTDWSWCSFLIKEIEIWAISEEIYSTSFMEEIEKEVDG